MWSLLSGIGSKLWGYISAFLAILVAILFALFKIQSSRLSTAKKDKDRAEEQRDTVVQVNQNNEKVREAEKKDAAAAAAANESITNIVINHKTKDNGKTNAEEKDGKIIIDNGWDQ